MDLKKSFPFAPILAHVDPQKPFFIEVNASNFALGSILSQQLDDGKLHPMAFHLHKLDTVKINYYKVHDKKLLAIVDSFEQWRHFLEDSSHQIIVSDDRKKLTYFQSTHVLNRRQARWAQSLLILISRLFFIQARN